MNLRKKWKNILAEAKDELDLCDLEWNDNYVDLYNYSPDFDLGQEDNAHFFAICMGQLNLISRLLRDVGSVQKKGRKVKAKCYNSTYGFIGENDLQKEADECFGEGWEAEDDCNQITKLLAHIGAVEYEVSYLEYKEEDDIMVSSNEDSLIVEKYHEIFG